MLKRVIPLTVLGLVLFVTERSFGLMEPPTPPRVERMFQRCDANHDGVIDAKEFEEGMKLLANERARPPREGRPQARPGPRPEARPGDESPPPPADMGPRPAPHPGPGADLDPKVVETVHEVLKRMLPQMQERMGRKLQEREGRMRGEFREGFGRAMRERDERAPEFVRHIVEQVWQEHRGEIQQMIDRSVRRAMREGPGRPGMRQPGMGAPGMRQPGMRQSGMGEPGMGRPPMPPPDEPGAKFRGEPMPPPELGEFGPPPGDERGRDNPPPPPMRQRGERRFRSDGPPPRGMRERGVDEPLPPDRREGAWRQDRPQRRETTFGRWANLRWLRDRAPWAELRDKVGQNFRPGFWRQWQQRAFAGGPPGRAKMNPNRIAKFRRMVAARVQRWMSGFEQDRGGFMMRDGFRGRPRNFDRFDRDGNDRPGRREPMRAG